jgi:O-antigen/teichoic acid export membrane protein
VRPVMLYKDFLQISWKFDWTLAFSMSRYAIPIVIAGFAFIINETIDRIMLKQILSEMPNYTVKKANAEIGIYSACYKLAMLITILLQAYRYAAEPFFFNQSKNQDRNKVYVKLMNYFVAVMCLVFLGVSLNIDIFRYFITSKTYWAGLDVVPILLMANVFLGIYINQSIWYKLSNQTKFGAFIAIGGAILTILINYMFIPEYGFRASAWATLIVYGAQMIASYFLGQKYYPIRYNRRKFFLYMGVALAIFFMANSFGMEEGSITKFLVNNALILVFVGLVMFMENIKLKKKPVR